jgi:hypothetical protein
MVNIMLSLGAYPQLSMKIDWAKVSELVLSGIITLLVSFGTLLLYFKFKEMRNNKREGILYDVSLLRGTGIQLRNQGEVKEFSEEMLREWQLKVKELETVIIQKASEFSKIESKRLDDLDRVRPLSYINIHNSQQITTLQNLSGILERADELLRKYHY